MTLLFYGRKGGVYRVYHKGRNRKPESLWLEKDSGYFSYREDGWKDTQSTCYKQKCSWVPKTEEGKNHSQVGEKWMIDRNIYCTWSTSSKVSDSAVFRNKYAHSHCSFVLQKLSFSSGLLEWLTCSPLIIWAAVVSGIFSKAVDLSLVHSWGWFPHWEFSDCTRIGKFLPSLLIHFSPAGCFFILPHIFLTDSSFSCPGQSLSFPS